MLRVFVPAPLPHIRQIPILEGVRPNDKRLFQHIPIAEFAGIFEKAGEVAGADCVLMPHNYTDLAPYGAYIESVLGKARSAKKRTIIFANQDNPEPIRIADATIFRPSLFRSKKLPNEVAMPAQVEDLGSRGVEWREKTDLPHVGFVGKAAFSSVREALRYYLRNYVLRRGAAREGIFYRRRALALLAEDPRIVLRANKRRRFGAHIDTIELSPEQARAEYLRSIIDSLYTLSPRGDGNYSLRFYETLSLGRIPVLIDTDVELPFADRIAYDEFIVRVPWSALHDLPQILVSWHTSRSAEELIRAQRRARSVFEEYLYMPSFLRKALTREYLRL